MQERCLENDWLALISRPAITQAYTAYLGASQKGRPEKELGPLRDTLRGAMQDAMGFENIPIHCLDELMRTTQRKVDLRCRAEGRPTPGRF